MGQTATSAASQMMENWEEWLIQQTVLMPFRGAGTVWRIELREFSQFNKTQPHSSTKRKAKCYLGRKKCSEHVEGGDPFYFGKATPGVLWSSSSFPSTTVTGSSWRAPVKGDKDNERIGASLL